MSVTHSSPNQAQPEILRCTRCHAELPRFATFCGQCGERVPQGPDETSSVKNTDIASRYRITSLLRKQPPTQLFLALDTQQQRPVVIYDIDISSLAEPERAQAIAAMQQEYDLLRQQRIPAIMPLVELRYFNGHLSIIAGWPYALTNQPQASSESESQDSVEQASTTEKQAPETPTQDTSRATTSYKLATLHDLLQSGIGLPTPEIALTWIARLSHALEQLHRHGILIGTIDPHTILISQHNYSGEPVLVICWLPDLLRELIPEPLNNAHISPFRAPESLLGATAPYSDIYSLGAILYLLLTGITPDNAQVRAHKPLPSLLERDPHCNPLLNALVMQALSYKSEERFQNASTFSEALASLLPRSRTKGAPYSRAQGKSQTEIHIASTPADNEEDRLDKASLLEEPEDMTVAVVPIQAQMARRYLSRIKTGKLGFNEPFTGEAPVEEGSHVEKTANAQCAEQHAQRERGTTTENQSNTQPAENHTGQALVDERPPSAQDEKAPETQVGKTASSSATDVKDTAPDQSEQTSTGDAKAYQEDITQVETILIKTDDMKLASALIGEAGNQSRHIRKPGTSSQIPNPTKEQQPSSQDIEEPTHQHSTMARFKDLLTNSLPRILHTKEIGANIKVLQGLTTAEGESSLVKRIQRFLLGEHQHVTTAAALIETPLRVQPHQSYTMRINVVGRSADKLEEDGGLSALSEGEIVHIEVRSALYQNYAYIVQQADVTIPAEGFVAEVSMPMQPLGSGPNGRRERLHVFFMDKDRNPLYEKPFVLELFISHLVHNGREGHNVLSIPL
jgi:Serine/threonine protein kinase